MTPIIISTSDDAAALSDFAVGSYLDTFGHLYRQSDIDAFLAHWNTPAALHAQLSDPEWRIAMICGEDGAILGFAKLGPVDFELPAGHPGSDACELHNLYVAPEAKGTGVAAALMDWAVAQARERASILYLSVFTDNPRAQAFYRRYGFVDIGRNPFRVGEQIDEDRIWRLDL